MSGFRVPLNSRSLKPAWTGQALRSVPAFWLALFLLAAVDVAWARSAGVAVAGWLQPLCLALALMVAGAMCRTSARWSKVGDMTDAAGSWIAFTAAGCVLTYLSARSGLPLRDDAMDALDRAMGFDWMAWSSWVAAHPALKATLRLSYMSLLPQIVFCCCALPLTGDAKRLSGLLWGALVAILTTCAVSALVPALGAFSYYGFAARADWLADLLALRGPGPVAFTLPEMKGIVSLPSYHAALAVLFIHAHRGTGVIGRAVTVLNLTMIVSTPSEGGHYLCDVIAGCLVAAASIAVVRYSLAALTASADGPPMPFGARPTEIGAAAQ